MRPNRKQFTLGSGMIAIVFIAIGLANPELAFYFVIFTIILIISIGLVTLLGWLFLTPCLHLSAWVKSRNGIGHPDGRGK